MRPTWWPSWWLAWCLLACAAAAPGAEVKTAPGVMAVVRAEGDRAVVWVNTHKGLQLVEDSSGKSCVVCALEEGEYTIAYVGEAKKAVYVVVHVQKGAAPGPGPGALEKALQAAWAKEKAAGRAAALALLRELYGAWARALADRPAPATWGALYEAMAQAAKTAGLAQEDLPLVRQALADHLRAQLPARPQEAMGAEGARRAAGAFATVAGALGKLS